jgi:hypothetical protein
MGFDQARSHWDPSKVSMCFKPIVKIRNYLHENGQDELLFRNYEQAKEPEE